MAAKSKRKIAPKAARGGNPSIADLREQLDRRSRERDEALARQAATADILRIISQSPVEVRPVFDSIVFTAVRLLHCDLAVLLLREGATITHAAAASPDGPYADLPMPFPLDPGANFPSRAIVDKTMLHLPDWSLIDPPEFELTMQKMWGVKSSLYLPLLREGDCIGVLGLAGSRPNIFGAAEIAQAEAFRNQAVIAIENVRLFEAEQQRTRELTESLEQQTATSEVLKVISSSPGDLEPVFTTILENAARICDAKFGNVYLWQGGVFRLVAAHNTPAAFAESCKRAPFLPRPSHPFSRMVATKRVVHVTDAAALPAYIEERDPQIVEPVELGGVRTCLAVPMLKENDLIGALIVYRQVVRPFTEKQIELIANFAAQAVIAIENTRLLNELRELLEQQTATAEVLRVISSSPSELSPVFQTMLANATRLCEAKFGILDIYGNGAFRTVAMHNVPQEFAELRRREPLVPSDPQTGLGRVLATKKLVHITDYAEDAAYKRRAPAAVMLVEIAGARTLFVVPMLKETELVGVIAIFRDEVRPFTEKQMELVQNFAAQAVIAIENTRLLTELRQRTDELAQRQAELSVTFDNMGDGVVMFNEEMRLAAWNKNLQEILDLPDSFFAEPRTYRDYMTYLIEHGEFGDVDLETELRRYIESADRQRRVERTRPDGRVLEVRVNPVPGGGFVAIYSDVTERKKAEERVRAARDAAESALRELKAAQDRLVQTEKLASLGQLTAGIAHEIKNPLNFVNNFSAVSVELIDELREALGGVHLDDKQRKEISEIADMLQGNLDKVVQHGKRADAIVKNMLLHSRQGSSEHRLVDINALVEESLNLAYHGARAEKQGFTITLERSFDPVAGEADLFPQEITRVLLNLISNGFYAATKRQAEADGADYEPTVTAATKNLGESVEIRIRDNGSRHTP